MSNSTESSGLIAGHGKAPNRIPVHLPPFETEDYRPFESNPFQGMWKLYIMHFFFAFVSRMWDMGIVLLLAAVTNNSLYLIALMGFASSASIFLLMPLIGSWLDHKDRLEALKIVMFVKMLAITAAYGISYLMFSPETFNLSDTQEQMLLYSLPLIAGIVGLSFSTVTQSIEKDWVVVLSDNDSKWLTIVNSAMSQIDLGCAAVAPAVTGYIFLICSGKYASLVLLVTNALGCLALFVFLYRLYNSFPTLAFRSDSSGSATPPAMKAEEEEGSNEMSGYRYSSIELHLQRDMQERTGGFYNTHMNSLIRNLGLKKFMESGCAGTMVSYSFLYCTVLSFGSLMTVYIRWGGITDHWIGIFRGMAAITGFAATLIYPCCRARFNLYNLGAMAIVFQAILVAIAASSFYWASSDVVVFVIIYTVLFSRTGLWMFDLCTRQICQEAVPESSRGVVNGQWRALIAFFDMTSYVMALWYHDPKYFGTLCLMSATMVFLALLLFFASNLKNLEGACFIWLMRRLVL